MPEQVQDFYPTPSTISTCMYYTGLDPRTMEPVYVATNPHEKAMQRALIQYRNPDSYGLVKEALHLAGREDLIGFEEHCLIPPRKMKHPTGNKTNGTAGQNRSMKNNKKNHTARQDTVSKNNKNTKNRTPQNATTKQSGGKRKPIRNVHQKKR